MNENGRRFPDGLNPSSLNDLLQTEGPLPVTDEGRRVENGDGTSEHPPSEIFLCPKSGEIKIRGGDSGDHPIDERYAASMALRRDLDDHLRG